MRLGCWGPFTAITPHGPTRETHRIQFTILGEDRLNRGEDVQAELSKVMVECEGVRNGSSLHDGEATGVSKRKVLVVILKNGLSCLRFVLGVNPNGGHAGGGKLTKKLSRRLLSKSHQEQSMGLSNNEVGGK